MTVHSHQKKKRRDSHMKLKSLGNHEEFLERITKTLYYVDLPKTERFSLPLSELAVELYSEVKYGKSLERLSLDDTAEITRNACVSPCSLVLAILYLEQLKTNNPAYVDRVTPSDLFVISLMVASKFLNDNVEDDVLNSEWAVSAGLNLSELNKFEVEFLDAMDWNVFINDERFWDELRALESRLALREGKRRGWFSYTELEALLDQVNAFLLARTLFTVSAVCLASYAAGMLTVIGSTIVASQLMYIPTPRSQVSPHLDANVTQTADPAWPNVPPESEGDYLGRLILEANTFNSSLDNCLSDPTDVDSCFRLLHSDGSQLEASVNKSSFFHDFFVPLSFHALNLPQGWKHPTLIFSK